MSIRVTLQAFALIAATPIFALAETDRGATGPAWSPYLVGGLIGVLSMFTFYFSNKPIGVSTAYARVAGLVGQLVARRHTDSLHYYAEKKEPKIGWEVMLGLMAGSYLFGEASGWIARTVNPWGDRGELTLERLFGVSRLVFVPAMAILVVLILAAVHFFIDPTP